MCLNPLHVVNPSRWIDINSFQQLYVDVPCGHCSECLISYRNEWRNRAYYECLDSFHNGKYLLFDTLTYRNGSLPHLSDFIDVPSTVDFPCFNLKHIQDFIGLLRTRLRRMGFFIANKLKFFLACEYGDDIRRSRRPHYHILFFVPIEIPYLLLSNLIAFCWIHGRTDGVPYRGSYYVGSHNVFTDCFQSSRFVVNYVTKYCTKDFTYNSLVSHRLQKLKEFSYSLYQFSKPIVRCFHTQSKGFGNDAIIKICGRSSLLLSGKFGVMQSNGIVKQVSIHKSLQRKLLYDYSRDSSGRVVWILNKDGFDFKTRFFEKRVDYLFGRVVGSNMFDSLVDIKNDCHDYIFHSDRFNVTDDIRELVENSYNINSGLRNYSACDKSFINKPIFTLFDYGSQRDGYLYGNELSEVFIPTKSNHFVSLSTLRDFTQTVHSKYLTKYFTSKCENGDSQLEVLKLKHRLNYKFKSKPL